MKNTTLAVLNLLAGLCLAQCAQAQLAAIQQLLMMAADTAAAPAQAPIPLVAGKDEVRITVSGSIQLR